MTVIVGWLVSANYADTKSLTVPGDKFVIGEESVRPWNRKITTHWETGYQKTLQRPLWVGGDRLDLWEGGEAIAYGPATATAHNRGNVQVIVRKDHRMRLSFLREQLVRSSEQLVLVDTKKGFFRPWTHTSILRNQTPRLSNARCHYLAGKYCFWSFMFVYNFVSL